MPKETMEVIVAEEKKPEAQENKQEAKEGKLVPAKDLDNLRSVLQKQLAEQAQQHMAELQKLQEAAEQARQEATDLTEVANLEPEDRAKLLNFRRVERELKKKEKDVLEAHRYVEQEKAGLALERAKAELLKEYPEVSMEDIAAASDIQTAELLALRKTHKMTKGEKQAVDQTHQAAVNRQETGEAKRTSEPNAKVLYKPTGNPRVHTLEFPDK